MNLSELLAAQACIHNEDLEAEACFVCPIGRVRACLRLQGMEPDEGARAFRAIAMKAAAESRARGAQDALIRGGSGGRT